MTSYTNTLNVTLNENDGVSHSNNDIGQISVHSATEDNSIIIGDEIKDSKKQKDTNKRSRLLDTFTTSRAKRQCLRMAHRIFSRVFPKSEIFDQPEFLSWLEGNQHLATIKGGASKICELLDKVRIENPGLDEIFFALAENNEKVNPHFFDIAQLVRPMDSIIHPPEWNKWNERIDSAATYVWSFDIPIEDIKFYYEEIEQNIYDSPHVDSDIHDHRPFIVAQFRNYLVK
jgi:hypothetical protein